MNLQPDHYNFHDRLTEFVNFFEENELIWNSTDRKNLPKLLSPFPEIRKNTSITLPSRKFTAFKIHKWILANIDTLESKDDGALTRLGSFFKGSSNKPSFLEQYRSICSQEFQDLKNTIDSTQLIDVIYSKSLNRYQKYTLLLNVVRREELSSENDFILFKPLIEEGYKLIINKIEELNKAGLNKSFLPKLGIEILNRDPAILGENIEKFFFPGSLSTELIPHLNKLDSKLFGEFFQKFQSFRKVKFYSTDEMNAMVDLVLEKFPICAFSFSFTTIEDLYNCGIHHNKLFKIMDRIENVFDLRSSYIYIKQSNLFQNQLQFLFLFHLHQNRRHEFIEEFNSIKGIFILSNPPQNFSMLFEGDPIETLNMLMDKYNCKCIKDVLKYGKNH